MDAKIEKIQTFLIRHAHGDCCLLASAMAHLVAPEGSIVEGYAVINDQYAIRHYWFEGEGRTYDIAHAINCVFKPSQTTLPKRLLKTLPPTVERVDLDTLEERMMCMLLEDAYRKLRHETDVVDFVRNAPPFIWVQRKKWGYRNSSPLANKNFMGRSCAELQLQKARLS